MSQKQNNNDITRKEAIKKMGSYAAFAALGTIIMLNPKKAQAQSGIPGPPGTPTNSPIQIQGARRNRNKK